MAIKVLYTTSTFPVSKTDSEPRFVLDLVKAAKQSNNEGSDLNILVLAPASPDCRGLKTIEGVKVYFYPYLLRNKWETLTYPGAILPKLKQNKLNWIKVPFLFLSLYLHTLYFKRKFQPQFLHAHWLIPQGILANLPFIQLPYFITAHAADIFAFNNSKLAYLKCRALSQAQAVFCDSSEGKEYLLNLMKKYPLLSTPHIIVVPQGVNRKLFYPLNKKEPPNNTSQNQPLKLITPPIKFIYVGRISEKKGILNLIKAVQVLVTKTNKPFTVEIVGRGEPWYEKQVKKEAANVLISKYISFTGPLSHSELPNKLRLSDVFVCPSIITKEGDREGIPTSLLEASTCGLALIATDIGDAKKAVTANTGILCANENVINNLSNAMLQLIDNPTLLTRFKTGALENAINFSWSKVTEPIFSKYHKLCKN